MEHDGSGGRFAYEGLDRIMHEKARLSIMASLYVRRKGHNFNELKKLCSLTDGNLSRHISILKEAGLLNVTKSYDGNKPVTTCELSETGRERFREYLAELEQVIRDASAVEKSAAHDPAEGMMKNRGLSPA